MKVYSPEETAKLLKIKQPTLRKYSIMLEEQGYKIERNSQNHRYYLDKDIITLRRVITGKYSGVTLQEAINNVVGIDKNNTYPNVINNGDMHNENDIKEILQKQNELIKGLTERLDRQQEYIEKRMTERDKLLMESLNEIRESKKQLAVAIEEKKGFFARLFNR